MEKTIPQLDTIYYQIKPSLPVTGTTFCVGQIAPIDNSKTLQNTANTIDYPLQPDGKNHIADNTIYLCHQTWRN